MTNFSDPTANTAIGAIDREIRRREDHAKALIRLRRDGKITEEQWNKEMRLYTGIFAGGLIRAEKAVDEEERKNTGDTKTKGIR